MLSAFMGFIEPGDEVILFEPFFDQYVPWRILDRTLQLRCCRYISNIEMAGGVIKYIPLHPPPRGDTEVSSAAEWTIDMEELERAITPRTRMIVRSTQRPSACGASYRIDGCACRSSIRRKPILCSSCVATIQAHACPFRHNPIGKVFSRPELEAIGALCVKHKILILSDEVYDRLYYVPFTRVATLSPDIWRLTLTVGSAGKNFYATGWRVGWLIGPADLVRYVAAAHTRICYSSVSPLQEAAAVGFEEADRNGFWEQSKAEMMGKVKRFNAVWHELGLPYSEPEGGYFVLVNMSKMRLPEDYRFPPHVASRPRDFKLSWFLIHEVGVAAIPPTGAVHPVLISMARCPLVHPPCCDPHIPLPQGHIPVILHQVPNDPPSSPPSTRCS